MTIREIKEMNRIIDRLRSKLGRLRSDVTNMSPSLSGMPGNQNVSDRIGRCVSEIADIEHTLNDLISKRDHEYRRLSKEIFEENCIYLFLVRRYSWRRIAQLMTGRIDTADSIRKRCYRYKW